MKDITNKFQTFYRYNGKFYAVSNRKDLRINDILLDGRDYGVKVIESEQDVFSMAFVDPELYVILEEVAAQN